MIRCKSPNPHPSTKEPALIHPNQHALRYQQKRIRSQAGNHDSYDFFKQLTGPEFLADISWGALFQPVPMGIALGLFLGNQLGIMSMSWLAVKTRLAKLPTGVGWAEMYGVAMLCGIGFTMSLFISSLAFEQGGPDFAVDDRIGILTGSILSAICGYLWLRWRFSSTPP